MKRVNRIFDYIMLALVSRRLARCWRRGDPADKFADALISGLTAEMARRNRLFDRSDEESKCAATAALEGERLQTARQRFEEFGSVNRPIVQ
jgi:hypothetical protein